MSIKKFNDSLVQQLKSILSAKYPDCEFEDSFRGFHLDNIYNPSGMKIINKLGHFTFTMKTWAPESSHPDLKKSITRVEFKLTYNIDGTYKIDTHIPIDSVDVHYTMYDAKICNRNITLGRKWNRKVSKYISGTLRNKIEMNGIIPKEAQASLQNRVGLGFEATSLKNELNKIKKDVLPSKSQQRLMQRTGQSCNVFLYGFSKEGHTYFCNGEKVGTKQSVPGFINAHPEFFIENFSTKYPLTSSKQQS